MLLIDVNSERSIDITTGEKNEITSVRDMFLGEARKGNRNLASIHIGTLAVNTRHGPGDYGLTVIKQMIGTENFLSWPQHKRGCSLETYENCQMRGFLEASSKCGCSPFQLLPAARLTDQVI